MVTGSGKEKLITRDDYYKLLAFYLLAVDRQKEVRRLESQFLEVIPKGMLYESLCDNLYSASDADQKALFDESLLNAGFMVQWQPAKKEIEDE